MKYEKYLNAAAGLAGAGQEASPSALGVAPPPCLMERLDHLRQGVERLQKLSSQLESIADNLSSTPDAPSSGCATPQPSDLNSQFGEVINHVHGNIDQMDYLVSRIRFALVGDRKDAMQAQKSAR